MNYWIDHLRIETGFHFENDWVSGVTHQIVAVHIIDGYFSDIITQKKFNKSGIKSLFSAENQLLLPSLVDSHVHLDKLKMGEPWTPIKPAKSIVERFEQEIPDLEQLPSSIEDRANKMLKIEQTHGVSTVRSHVDVEPMTGLRHFNAIKQVQQTSSLNIEIVVFPQHGLLRSQSLSLVEQALETGADYIGGVDPYTLDGDYKKSLAETFNLANKYQVGVDIHVHDRNEAGMKTIEEIIRLTQYYHLQGKVFISHAFGLNDFKDTERTQIFSLLAREKIAIVTSVPLDSDTIPPIMELIEAGVSVHVGNDNVDDSWSPYGTGSMQDKLARLGEMYFVKDQIQLTQLLSLGTNGKTTLDRNGKMTWPVVNQRADFMIVDALSAAEFLARQSTVFSVFNGGKIIESNF